jgi:hypothetical protein
MIQKAKRAIVGAIKSQAQAGLLGVPLILGALASGGCASPSSYEEVAPSILVTNPLCNETGCRTIRVGAFLTNAKIPQPPLGFKVVGEVSGRTGCLHFPASWYVTVSGPDIPDPSLTPDTIWWTPNDEVIITIVDAAASPFPSVPYAMSEEFTPTAGGGQGWEIGWWPPRADGSEYWGKVSPGGRCRQ